MNALPPERQGPSWTQGELAWPLSLFAGFGGTWVGLTSGVPGLATCLAAGLVAFLVVGLWNRGEPMRAFGAGMGGVVGAGGAVLGSVFDVGAQPLYALLPGAGLIRRHLGLLFAGEQPPAPELALLYLGLPLVALVLCRGTKGIAPLLAATFLAGATALPVGARAELLVDAGGHRLLGLALGWPPGSLLQVAGLVALAVAWSGPRGSSAPRPLVVGGLSCLALGVGAWGAALPWAKLVGPTLGLG